MQEERRAWENAERLLRDLGFDNWRDFKDAQRFSLAAHVRRGTPEVALSSLASASLKNGET